MFADFQNSNWFSKKDKIILAIGFILAMGAVVLIWTA